MTNGSSGSVSAFDIALSGALGPIPGSPFAAGTSLRDSNVSAYAIAADGSLAAVLGSPFATGAAPSTVGFQAVAITPDTEITGAKLKVKKTQKQGKKVKVKLRVFAGEPVALLAKGKVKLEGERKAVKLKPRRKSADAGERVDLVLKPAKKKGQRKILRALGAGKKATAKVSVRFRDVAGNKLVRKAKVKLR